MDEIKRSLPGTTFERTISSELDGTLAEFGSRFLTYARAVPRTGIDEQVRSGIALTSLAYTDRYLTNPLAMSLLVSSLSAIRQGLGGDKPNIKILVTTRIAKTETTIRPDTWRQDWEPQVRREDIFAQACANAGFAAEYKELTAREIKHAREFVLTWADGARHTVRLDEGFGFIQLAESRKFPFAGSAALQARAIGDPDTTLHVRRRINTLLYVSAIGR